VGSVGPDDDKRMTSKARTTKNPQIMITVSVVTIRRRNFSCGGSV
jgi:hypothetical protein